MAEVKQFGIGTRSISRDPELPPFDAFSTTADPGQPVIVTAMGADANIGFRFITKGAGAFQVQAALEVSGASNLGSGLANMLIVTGGATTVAPRLEASGIDTNINIELLPKGFQNGTVRTTRMLVGTQSQWPAYQGTMTSNTNMLVRSVAGSVPAAMAPFHQWYVQPSGGTVTSGGGVYNAFNVVGDGANMAALFGGYGLLCSISMAASARGGRNAVSGIIDSAVTTADTGSFYYVGVFGAANGTAAPAAGGSASPHLFGANFATRTTSGSTGWFGQTGVEIDVRTAAGASSSYTAGLSIVHDPTHAVAGSVEDVAMLVADTYTLTPTSPGWTQGIFAIGSRTGVWPAAATANLLHVQRATLSGLPYPKAANGVYFDPVVFGIAAWSSPGSRIGPAGHLTVGPNVLTWSAAGLTIENNGQVAALSSIAAAGAAYLVGETLTTAQGGDLWQVATIDGSGGITSLTLLVAPTITSGSPPANPVALTGSANGGSATINLTWTAANVTKTTGGRVRANRVVTAAGAVTVTKADDTVVVNKVTGAATVVNLPASPVQGQRHTIKDGKGDAATNNITITPAAGNIDGAGTLVLATNYAVAAVEYNGTQWNRVAA